MTVDLNITEFTSNIVPVNFHFEKGGVTINNRKLAQSWIKMFLTEQGSQQYAPDNGTAFLQAMRNGSIRNAANVTTNFKIAADAIAETLRADPLTNALPETEQIVEAILDSFEILVEKSTLKLFITLIPVLGDAISFDVPISTKA